MDNYILLTISLLTILTIFVVFFLKYSTLKMYTKILFFFLFILSFWYLLYYIVNSLTNNSIPNPDDVLTWINIDIQTSDTWTIIPISDIDKYQNIITSTKNYKTIQFTIQPSESVWSYWWNTETLRTYMMQNIRSIEIPPNISSWYLYIKLRKQLSQNRSIVLWTDMRINWFLMYWWLKTKESLDVYNENEYLFKLDNVPLVTTKEHNWLSVIKLKRIIKIWWYVWTFDWNKIEEITIAWE